MTIIDKSEDFRALLNATCTIVGPDEWETADRKNVMLHHNTWVVTMLDNASQDMGELGADYMYTDLLTVFCVDWFGEREIFKLGGNNG